MRHTLRQQRTLARAVEVTGFGFWTGRDVRVEFRPADPQSGIVFVRGDLPGCPRIQAGLKNRIETPRRTTLSHGGAAVEMVEHIMAALAGLQIDNCEVWASGAEMPGLDGSSQPFVEALLSGGIVNQHATRGCLLVTEVTRVGSEDSWVEARPSHHGALSLKYRLDYGSRSPIGRQTFQLRVTPEAFCRQLAPARTFLLQQEAEWLQSRGLGSRVTPADVLVFDERGPLGNELRYEDECVRHKTLDLLGDLALAGYDLAGHIVAVRSGHRLNAELVRALLAEGEIVEERRKIA